MKSEADRPPAGPTEAAPAASEPGSETARWRAVVGPLIRRYLRTGGLLIALLGIGIYFTIKSQFFLTVENVYGILLQSANIAIIAAGLTVVLIAAEIDLSIGSLEALSGAVAAVLIINHGLPTWLGIAAGLGSAALAGLISGLFTWKLKVVSFISTLAMLGIAQGIAFLLTNGEAVAGFPTAFTDIGQLTIGNGFPVAVIIAIGVFVALHLMLTRTRLGLHIYAVGGNAESAALAGIKPGRIKLITLVICGFCGGIAGLVISARLDAGNGLFGAQDLLPAVAAVVIGGTSLFGGVGSVVGTGIGVLMITTINNGMVLLNVPDFWQLIVVGCLILGAMVLDQLTKSAAALRVRP